MPSGHRFLRPLPAALWEPTSLRAALVFISGGITHASFGGIGIGYFLGWNPLLGAAIFSVLSGLGIQYFTRTAKLREDSSIAIWWSLGMAIGIIFIYLSPGYAPNLMSYLFGSILTVSTTEIWIMAALSLVLVCFFVFMYRAILYVAFNEEFAKTTGLPVNLINYILISLIAVTIVMNIRVVGIILIMSLLTLPQATANLFTHDFRHMMLYSVGFAFIGSFAGLLFFFFRRHSVGCINHLYPGFVVWNHERRNFNPETPKTKPCRLTNTFPARTATRSTRNTHSTATAATALAAPGAKFISAQTAATKSW